MGLILVDLDGTLLPLEAWDPVFYELAATVASRAGVKPEEFWGMVRVFHYQLIRRLSPRAFDWQYVVEAVAANFGVYDVPKVEDVLLKYVEGFTLVDGALDLLKGINELGYRAAIATNGLYRYQYIVIKKLGLDKYISEIRTSDMYNCPKTCREFFAGAAAIVGDNPVFDIYFPRKYGLRTVFVGDWDYAVRKYENRIGISLDGVSPDYTAGDLRAALRAIEKIAELGRVGS